TQVTDFGSQQSAGLSSNGSTRGFWRSAPWLVRAALALPAILFVRIGWKYLTAPFQVAAGSDMSLGSPAAVTDMRAFGGIFLALAVVIALSLMRERRLRGGLIFVAIVIGIVTAARVFGVL